MHSSHSLFHCSNLGDQLTAARAATADGQAAWALERAAMDVSLRQGEEALAQLRGQAAVDRQVRRSPTLLSHRAPSVDVSSNTFSSLLARSVDGQALTWLHSERDRWTATNEGLVARTQVGLHQCCHGHRSASPAPFFLVLLRLGAGQELEADKGAHAEAVRTCHARLEALETLAAALRADGQAAVDGHRATQDTLQATKRELAEALHDRHVSVHKPVHIDAPTALIHLASDRLLRIVCYAR